MLRQLLGAAGQLAVRQRLGIREAVLLEGKARLADDELLSDLEGELVLGVALKEDLVSRLRVALHRQGAVLPFQRGVPARNLRVPFRHPLAHAGLAAERDRAAG